MVSSLCVFLFCICPLSIWVFSPCLSSFHICSQSMYVASLYVTSGFSKGRFSLTITKVMIQLFKHPPRGPIIMGNYLGLCGVSPIHVSRKPLLRKGKDVGKASWTEILATLHPFTLLPQIEKPRDSRPWIKRLDNHTYKHDLVMQRGDKSCIIR